MSDIRENLSQRTSRWRGAWRCLLLAAVMLPFPWVRISCVETRPDGKKTVGTTVTQTGIQATYGGATLDQGNGNLPLDNVFPGMNAVPAQGLMGNAQIHTESKPQPMMILYVAALVFGIAGVWMFADRDRHKVIRTASVAALLTLGIQTGWGLPLVSKTTAGAAPGGAMPASIEVSYSPWFWVAVGSTVASVVLAFVNFCGQANPAPFAEKAPRDDWPGAA